MKKGVITLGCSLFATLAFVLWQMPRTVDSQRAAPVRANPTALFAFRDSVDAPRSVSPLAADLLTALVACDFPTAAGGWLTATATATGDDEHDRRRTATYGSPVRRCL